MRNFESVGDFLAFASPADPVICHRPQAAHRAARYFLDHFPGEVLYAVKANPAPVILEALYDAGVRRFDVASPAEIEMVSKYPDAIVYGMNPVKHPAHIRSAYFDHGVRRFALDSMAELEKILAATENAKDLQLFVRLEVDCSHSALPLERKFGASLKEAADLLVAARLAASYLGACFHVGSQAMQPASFGRAVQRANQAIGASGVVLDALDVGGGFPAAYPGMSPQPLDAYFAAIEDAFEDSLTSNQCALLCEPGRALVAESASLLVHVNLRKGDTLYINDGAYGALFDAAYSGFRYPARLWRDGRLVPQRKTTDFALYGPTCDSADYMPGPFPLPADAREGDYIEIGQLGAYGDTMRSNFNGFAERIEISVDDAAMLSLYGPAAASAARVK